jgi:hypothetical protein
MKIGHGNGYFIADAHNARLSLDEIRSRWRRGDYGKVRAEFAQGWLKMAGRTQ